MNDQLDLIDEILSLIKLLQKKIKDVDNKLKNYALKEELEKEINRLVLSIDELKEKINNIYKEIDPIALGKVKNLPEIESKLNVIYDELSKYAKIDDIIEIKYTLNNISGELDRIKEEISKISSSKEIDTIREVVTSILKSLEEMENKIGNLDTKIKDLSKLEDRYNSLNKNILSYNIKIEEIEKNLSELSEKLEDSIKNVEKSVQKELEDINKKLQELKFLQDLSKDDINFIRNLKGLNIEEIYKKVLNVENRLNNLVSSVSKIIEDMKSKVYLVDMEKNKSLESRIDLLEQLSNTMKKDVEDMKRELKDLKDLLIYLNKENERVLNRIKELEQKIAVIGIENLYDYIDKIKILEDEVIRLKTIIRTGEYDKIKNLEESIRLLYEQQNRLMKAVNDILSKL